MSFPLRSLPVTLAVSPQDYHRPSVEEILENPLIADLVAEEQRNPERRGRRSGEPEKLQDSSPVLSELKLKEIHLQERERALKAREESLERESGWGEAPELFSCVWSSASTEDPRSVFYVNIFINTCETRICAAKACWHLRAEPPSPRSFAVIVFGGTDCDSPAQWPSPCPVESLLYLP